MNVTVTLKRSEAGYWFLRVSVLGGGASVLVPITARAHGMLRAIGVPEEK